MIWVSTSRVKRGHGKDRYHDTYIHVYINPLDFQQQGHYISVTPLRGYHERGAFKLLQIGKAES